MAFTTQQSTHVIDFSSHSQQDLTMLKLNNFMKSLSANGILLTPKDDGGLKLHSKTDVAPELLAAIKAQKEPLHAYLTQPHELDNPCGPYPLSEQQDGLWLAYQADPASSAYNEPLIFSFVDPINIDAVRASINDIHRQIPLLRLCFATVDGIPSQWVLPPFAENDYLTYPNQVLSDSQYQKQLETVALTPFDLTTGPLFRAGIFKLTSGVTKFVLVLPHILTDGWASMSLVEQLIERYKTHSESNSGDTLVAVKTPEYCDVVLPQTIETHRSAAQRLNFWSEHFSVDNGQETSVVEPGVLPALYAADTSDENLLRIVLSTQSTTQLEDISRKLHVSDASTCLALYSIAFAKTALLNEFIVSTPFINRNDHKAQNYMGLRVNTLPIRIQVNSQLSLAEHIQQTHQNMLEYIEQQDTPLEWVLQQSSMHQGLSSEHLFQSVFEYQTFDNHVNFGGIIATFDDNPYQAHKFPLTFLLRKSETLTLEIEFDTSIYHRHQIEALATAFSTVLNTLIDDMSTPVSSVSLLGSNAEQYLTDTFNYSHTQWDEHYALAFHNINELLYQRVLQQPENVAVKTTQYALSYRELFTHGLAITDALNALALPSEAVIGVFMPTSSELLIAMMGTFMSGKVYLPLDPALPDQRLQRILQKSCCQAIIYPAALDSRIRSISTESNTIHTTTFTAFSRDTEKPPESPPTLIKIDDLIDISAHLPANPIPELPVSAAVQGNQLAYAIFTSGSSGEPKGAMIEHEGMLNHLLAKADDLGVTAATTIGFIATPSFDVSIWQMLSALAVGGTTAIFEGDAAWDPEQLFAQINQQQVNVIESVPSHLNALLEYLHSTQRSQSEPAKVPDDFLLMLNGEPLLQEQCLRWQQYFPNSQLVNAYGLTEVSDDTCHFHIASADIAKKYQCMPISGTLPNLKLYILDHDLCPVPSGVKGELYIGGIAVGRGYLGDPNKTAERFIPDPFAANDGGRLYRSGDVVWADNEGAIHFLGRNDFQIKVRGFRIEVQEIENAIHQLAGVDNVAVMVDGAGDHKQILAFYQFTATSQTATPVTPDSVRTHLLNTLPHYMVPDCIEGYAEFPLTTNGKIDRKTLLANRAQQQKNTDTVNTQYDNDTQATLARIFSSTLNIAQVGKHQSFYTLGGNSLIALRIVNQIRTAFDCHIKVSDILKNETIAKLAVILDNQETDGELNAQDDVIAALNAINKHEAPSTSLLTPYQLPEWYMYRVEPDNPYYNISFPNIFFNGPLNVAAFLSALQCVVARHRALRSRFVTENGEPIVEYDDNITIDPNNFVIEHQGLSPQAIEAKVIEYADTYNHLTLNLGKCCFETKLIKYRDDYYQFIWVVHHIIWDETSTLVFFDELSSAYNAFAQQQPPAFAQLPFDYSDFERTINGLLDTPAMQQQKAYWDAHLANAPALVNLPTDRPRQPSQTFNGDGVLFHFNAAEKQRIEDYLAQQNTTLFIYLLSILNLALFKITGETDQVIGAPIANRDSEGLQKLIGLFATALPLRSQLQPQQTFAQFLAQSKTVATDGFDNHNYPSIFALRDSANRTQGVSSTNVNRFNIMYGVQNDKTQWKQSIDFEGVEYIERDEIGITEGNTARFDLTIVVDYVDDAIEVYFNFNTDLFDKSRIEFYLNGFRKLVVDTLTNDSLKLHQYTLIDTKFPDWRASFTAGSTMNNLTNADSLPELALNACQKYASLIAINDHGDTYTYAQLQQGIARYSHVLAKHRLPNESPVVVYAAHNFNALCAMIAIMHSGATYIPLFASTPAERAIEVISQADAQLVFAQEDLCHFALIQQHVPVTVLPLDASAMSVATVQQNAFTAKPELHDGQLAYQVFTSGSTGKPKGIAIAHNAIMNTIASTIAQHHFTQSDNLLLMTESHFDPYFLDVFCALATGAKLVIIPECERKTPSRILENIDTHQITFFQGTPTFLDALCAELTHSPTNTDNVRIIITGGEQLTPAISAAVQRAFPQAYLANHYGPSEVAVDAISSVIAHTTNTENTEARTAIPIGYPIANTAALVLDDNLEAVPVNHVGELYVLSPGLARNYVSLPALTAERFMPSPYARFAGERMYRTGDKVRMDKHGNVFFIGREDEQLKINGSRVELTEIEAVIANQQGVDVAAVIYQRQAQSGYLAAYLKMSNPRHVVTAKTQQYTLFPLAHKPRLLLDVTQLHAQSWPAFFEADLATKRYWSTLMQEQANDQLLLINEALQLAGAIHSTRIHWDGEPDSLMGGWSAAIAQGVALAQNHAINRQQATDKQSSQQAANTLVALAALVAEDEQGQKLSSTLLAKIKEHAIAEGMDRCIIPLRVTGKSRFPEMSFDQYAKATTENGAALDPWLNIHLNAGAKVIAIAPHSQRMVAPRETWQTWLNQTLDNTGKYTHPLLHTHLTINAQGEGIYDEPCIWVEHPLNDTTEKASSTVEPFVHPEQIRTAISQVLPSYMIPSAWHTFTALPSNINGKVDKIALQKQEALQAIAEIKPPQTELEQGIHRIWCAVLKTQDFGVRCNFFMLGGHSFSALQSLEKINRQYASHIELKAFLLNPTIESLCQMLTSRGSLSSLATAQPLVDNEQQAPEGHLL